MNALLIRSWISLYTRLPSASARASSMSSSTTSSAVSTQALNPTLGTHSRWRYHLKSGSSRQWVCVTRSTCLARTSAALCALTHIHWHLIHSPHFSHLCSATHRCYVSMANGVVCWLSVVRTRISRVSEECVQLLSSSTSIATRSSRNVTLAG